jgi:hypothetical protein
LTTSEPLYIVRLASRLAAYNIHEVATDVASITTTLESAGISMSKHIDLSPPGVDLSSAYTAARLPSWT